jgi:hypothetical protein
MVSMTGGSPSLRRSRLIVILTALVNGGGELVPDPFQEFLGRDGPALGREQQFKHAELFRGQVKPALSAEGAPFGGVDHEVPVPQDRGMAGWARRISAPMRARSTGKSNGLGR